MYSFKEKNKHLKDLLSPEHAQKDFDHLKSIEPNNINVMLTTSSVEKNAEKILFNLLDLKTREEITAYRRNYSAKKSDTVKPAKTTTPAKVKSNKSTKAVIPAKAKADKPSKAAAPSKADKPSEPAGEDDSSKKK